MEKMEQFEELINKVVADAELQKLCAEAIKEGRADQLLKEKGYNFTLDELITYIEEKNEDMSPEELEGVSGARVSRDTGSKISATVTWVGVITFAQICFTTTRL